MPNNSVVDVVLHDDSKSSFYIKHIPFIWSKHIRDTPDDFEHKLPKPTTLKSSSS